MGRGVWGVGGGGAVRVILESSALYAGVLPLRHRGSSVLE